VSLFHPLLFFFFSFFFFFLLLANNLIFQELVDHLVKYRVGHWDQAIRELAAKSLAISCKTTVDCILFAGERRRGTEKGGGDERERERGEMEDKRKGGGAERGV
jgi:hypothetical protein